MTKYLIFILTPLLGFFLVRYGSLDRQILDLSLFICIFFLCIFSIQLWLLMLLVFLFTLVQIDGLNDYYWFLNFTIIGIALLKSKRNIIDTQIINEFSIFLVLYIFLKTIFDFMTSDFVEGGDRIAGPFTSSLHLAYFSVIYSFTISITKPSFKKFQIFLLLISAGLSGSRVGAAGVFFIMFIQFSLTIKLSITALITLYFLFNGIPDIRVLSYIPEAESIRFGGFLRYIENIYTNDLMQTLFGFGRKNYGAVGFRFFGDNVFITESSLVMLVYCYGILLGLFLFYYICISIIRIGYIHNHLTSAFVIIIFIIFSPFIDSPAIFFINLVLLASVVRPVKEKVSTL